MSLSNQLKKASLRTAFGYLEKNPEENALKLMSWVDKLAGEGPDSFPTQRAAVRNVLEDPQNNMYQLVMSILKETDPGVLKATFENFFLNANIIECRLKSPGSMLEKLGRKGCPIEMQSLREGILDIAGVRVVCNYLNDVNLVADLLLSQDDIRLLKKKDFISNPKPNGYRSLHLIVSVPIFLAGTTEHIPVEIQIRTIAMDYWASLEHHLKYKTENDVSDSLKCRLKHDADLLSAIDADLQDIFCQMNA